MNYKPYKHLPPFKGMVLQNFPFIEEDFDAITNYQLLCKVVEYLKNVIANELIMEENVTNLYNSFVELKNYVDNYFANLDVQEEINNKIDDMVEDGTFESIVGSYLSKKLDYFKITSSMSENDIINIIENNTNAKIIEFEKGTYIFTNDIHINSNTKFILNGSTLKTTNNKMLLFYKANDTFTSYDGVHDVIFENGIMGISSALMHNFNITFNGINFLSTLTTHAIQIAGSKDIKITNCIFNGIVLNDSIGNVTEMIQIEPCTSAGQPYISSDSPMFNNLGNYNVEISNCIFNKGDGVNSKFYVGIGHHSANSENIYNQEYITIKNNKFINPTYSGISIYGLADSIIENNYFELTDNISDHIMIRFRGNNKNVNINNNKFNGYKRAIENVNLAECSNFKIYRNEFIADNDISSNVIVLKSFIDTEITDNYIENNATGILLAPYSGYPVNNIKISNNKFINTSNFTNSIKVNDGCDGIIVVNNFAYIEKDAYFMNYLSTEETKPLYFANNFIENNNYNPKYITIGSTLNIKNVYNKLFQLYSSNSTYASLTNQTPDYPFNSVDRLDLTFCVAGGAGNIFTETIHGYDLRNKMLNSTDSTRKFYFNFIDNSGVSHFTKFQINTDGTFTFSSVDDSITLLSVYGYNILEK